MKVLLGLAGGDESIKTLRETIERTAAVDDELTVAIVDKPESKRSQEEMYERASELLAEAELDSDIRALEGDPGSTLVEFTEQGGFDQLVIGGGTVSPMGKIRLGPVTEFVLLNAPTTVKLVR